MFLCFLESCFARCICDREMAAEGVSPYLNASTACTATATNQSDLSSVYRHPPVSRLRGGVPRSAYITGMLRSLRSPSHTPKFISSRTFNRSSTATTHFPSDIVFIRSMCKRVIYTRQEFTCGCTVKKKPAHVGEVLECENGPCERETFSALFRTLKDRTMRCPDCRKFETIPFVLTPPKNPIGINYSLHSLGAMF